MIDFPTVFEALRNNELGTVVAQLTPDSPILHQTNSIPYAEWFSGNGMSLLQIVSFRKPEYSLTLLELGAELDLHSACALGELDRIREILDADPLAIEQQIDTYYPIQFALSNTDSLRLLLERGDDANRSLKKLAWFSWEDPAADAGLSDWRLMHMVALSNRGRKQLELAQILKDHGAKLDHAAQPFGDTPLHIAAIYNQAAFIHWVIENGVQVDVRVARTDQNAATTELFDDEPFKLFDSYEGTALMCAAAEGHKDAVEALLKCGADANAKDSANLTPLHFAAGALWQENTEIVKLLLQHSANPQARDSDGRTPRDLAGVRGYEQTAQLLA